MELLNGNYDCFDLKTISNLLRKYGSISPLFLTYSSLAVLCLWVKIIFNSTPCSPVIMLALHSEELLKIEIYKKFKTFIEKSKKLGRKVEVPSKNIISLKRKLKLKLKTFIFAINNLYQRRLKMPITVKDIGEMFNKDVFTNKGFYCGKVNDMEFDLSRFKIRALVISADKNSILGKMIGGKKWVIVPYPMVQAIGDIVIIKHISETSLPEESSEEAE